MRRSPSKLFGSGNANVASVPVISTNPCRGNGESKEKMLLPEAPPANCVNALTWVGTVTSNTSPAFGPDPMVRCARDVPATAATCVMGPNACTSVVR